MRADDSGSATSPPRARRRPQRRRRVAIAAVGGLVAVGGLAGVGVGFRTGSGSSKSATDATPQPSRAPRTTSLPTVTTVAAPAPVTAPAVPTVITNGPRDRRAVALTFDSNLTDAMIQELDQHRVASFANVAVIDELDQLQVPATIFLAGKWVERYPDLTRRLASDALFELGSHSYAHRAYHRPCYGLGSLRASEMAADLDHSELILREFTNHPTPYFRFPGGCYDEQALRALATTSVTVIQYDLPSGDAFGTSVRAIVNNVVTNTRNGSIIVMHITGGNTAPLIAQALPDIVHGLRQRGFDLVRVSDLLASLAVP